MAVKARRELRVYWVAKEHWLYIVVHVGELSHVYTGDKDDDRWDEKDTGREISRGSILRNCQQE